MHVRRALVQCTQTRIERRGFLSENHCTGKTRGLRVREAHPNASKRPCVKQRLPRILLVIPENAGFKRTCPSLLQRKNPSHGTGPRQNG